MKTEPLTDREAAKLLCGFIGTLMDVADAQVIRRAVSCLHLGQKPEDAEVAPTEPAFEGAALPKERLDTRPARRIDAARAAIILNAMLRSLLPIASAETLRRAVSWVHHAAEYWSVLESEAAAQVIAASRASFAGRFGEKVENLAAAWKGRS